LSNVVCTLLANVSKPIINLLALRADPASSQDERGVKTEETETEDSTIASRLGLPPLKIPGWLGGDAAPKESKPTSGEGAAAKQANDTKKPEGVQPAAAEGAATLPQPEMPVAASPAAAPAPAPPMNAGCPVGSLQESLVNRLQASFAHIREDGQSLQDLGAIHKDLLLGIEKGVMALYNYRGCPPVAKHEFKTRHVCDVHRKDLATALQLMQGDVPNMRSRVSALQSRLRDIESGKSTECFNTQTTTRQPLLNPKRISWCLELQAVVDSLLDERRSQTLWLKDMGDGIQRLGAMSMQLNQHIHDPVLKRDKIPLNALKALTRSWISLQSPTNQLRMMGSKRAKEAVEIDVSVLKLASLLRNVSNQEHCISEGFRMRYSAQTCSTVRVQLSADVQARRTDLAALQQEAQKMMLTASDGITDNKCTAPPVSPGCWLRLPKGCASIPAWKSADKWTRDVFGERSTGAAQNKVVCTVSRKIQMDNLCGVANTEMRFIPS